MNTDNTSYNSDSYLFLLILRILKNVYWHNTSSFSPTKTHVTSHLDRQQKSLPTSAIDDGFRTLSDIVKQIAILDAFHMTMSAVNKVTATCIVN
jgi:hypothetical protein